MSATDGNDARVLASKFISKDARVLDVGCACGDFGMLLKKTRPCEIYGIDFDADSIMLASSTGVYKHLEQVDLNTFNNELHAEWREYFDSITFLDVLEHVINPLDSLKNLLVYLKPDGGVIVSLPNIAFGDIKAYLMNNEFHYTSTGILDSTHLRFFTYKSIAGFLADAGLVVESAEFKLARLDSNLKNQIDGELFTSICSDLHSFVYQYVLQCKRSDRPFSELSTSNLEVIDGALKNARKRLLWFGAKEIVSAALPPGSKWRRMLKALILILRAKSR
ncbi:class I SAM-dependent methyltransferase [Laribacter hongkongensis]|uniref:class I SAM-dependent methyltransferase n=1 Tax=Laribacter hongkongensis TaxID=168471 RepID=UPI001EFC5A66|nr:class I SAM-dependent methyltransferase [Laribacter hongkongensis]MCG9120384.1 class I SAM-dependent methyltransferase [Laribacter hongkongensis]